MILLPIKYKCASMKICVKKTIFSNNIKIIYFLTLLTLCKIGHTIILLQLKHPINL